MACKITFFNRKKNLGTYDCPERSNQEMRNEVATANSISNYTRFVLDYDRITGWVKNGVLTSWSGRDFPKTRVKIKL
jgi:hypothetical protein